MRCNKPLPSPKKGKKFVVLACKGNEKKIIHFGASDYEDYTQHKDKKRRKSFRARHRCDTDPPKKTTARYWSCNKLW